MNAIDYTTEERKQQKNSQQTQYGSTEPHALKQRNYIPFSCNLQDYEAQMLPLCTTCLEAWANLWCIFTAMLI